MKIIAGLLCVGMVVSGIVYSVVMAESPFGSDQKLSSRNSQRTNEGQPRAVPTLRTPKQLEEYGRTPRQLARMPQNLSGPPETRAMGQFPPSNTVGRNDAQGFRSPRATRSFSTGRNAVSSNAKPSTTYPNAITVQTLIRVSYHLPKEAADVLEQLFKQDSSASVETQILEKADSPFVVLKITTDSARQQSIANFLNSLYPKETLDKMQSDFDEAKDTATDSTSPQPKSELEEIELESSTKDVGSLPLSPCADEPRLQKAFPKDFPAE